MKNNRKLLVALLVVTIVVCLLSFAACSNKKYVQQTDTAVYFTVDKKIMSDVEGKTLMNYMDALVEKGYLTYKVDNTYGTPMVVTVNDKTADASKNEYYFIYSDDADNTTEAWGTTEIDGKKYSSTNFGIADQPLKMGATYVFMISSY